MADSRRLDFPSLASPAGHKALFVPEIAALLGCSVEHVYDLIDEGRLRALNIASGNNRSSRRELRVPVSSWHAFVDSSLARKADGGSAE